MSQYKPVAEIEEISSAIYCLVGENDSFASYKSMQRWCQFSRDYRGETIFSGDHFYLLKDSSRAFLNFLESLIVKEFL